MTRAILIDRDGVCNKNTDYRYITSVSDLHIYKDVEALEELDNFLLMILTNQGCIGKGIVSRKEVDAINDCLVSHLERLGISILDVMVSESDNPAHEDRKPNAGMAFKLQEKYGFSMKDSYLIGDSPYDIGCANNAGCRSIWINRPENKENLDRALNGEKMSGFTFEAKDLYEAVHIIKMDSHIYRGPLTNDDIRWGRELAKKYGLIIKDNS